jgi:hypothetical protein
MQEKFASKLKSIGFELPEWCLPPSEALVREYERCFSPTLPYDYRDFLVHHAGVCGSANCPFQEPTPWGPLADIDSFYGFTSADRQDNVMDATELIDGAPDVVAIGKNLLGQMFWLKCSGRDSGYVYMYDHHRRSAWTDAAFYEWFPNLHPNIKQYLALRAQGKLPKKQASHEHIYQLATSFGEFIDRLRVEDDS